MKRSNRSEAGDQDMRFVGVYVRRRFNIRPGEWYVSRSYRRREQRSNRNEAGDQDMRFTGV